MSHDAVAVGSGVRQPVKERFEAGGITIPFPIRTIYFPDRAADNSKRLTGVRARSDGKRSPWQGWM